MSGTWKGERTTRYDQDARVEGYVKLGKSKYWMVCGRMLHMHERPNQEISHENN